MLVKNLNKQSLGEKKESAKALLSKIWSNRKCKEINDILNNPNPSIHHRCYFAGFLRYGVGLSVNEIVEICDAYAKWTDYDRDITRYYLQRIGKESKTQRAIRTLHREDERSEDTLPKEYQYPDDAKRWIDTYDSSGFLTGGRRVEGRMG